MEKRTSRKELRNEARSAKKQKKFDSWLQHQQTQKMRTSLPNLKSTQALQTRKNSQAQRHEYLPSLNSSIRVKKDLETFPRVDASKVVNRSLKRAEGSNRKAKTSMESCVDLHASPRLESSKVETRSLKRKDASNKNSKTIFMECLEMEKKGEATSADIDLRLERRHAKKLKVKNEKLRGDDDIDMLLEGIPSVVDSHSQLSESLEGTDIDTSRKKQKKKSVDEVLNGKFVPEDGKFDPSCVSDVDHGNTDLQTKQKESKKMKRKKTKFEEYLETEMRGRVISADDDLALERKLAKKLKVKGGRLQGGDDEINMLFEGIPSVLDFLRMKIHNLLKKCLQGMIRAPQIKDLKRKNIIKKHKEKIKNRRESRKLRALYAVQMRRQQLEKFYLLDPLPVEMENMLIHT